MSKENYSMAFKRTFTVEKMTEHEHYRTLVVGTAGTRDRVLFQLQVPLPEYDKVVVGQEMILSTAMPDRGYEVLFWSPGKVTARARQGNRRVVEFQIGGHRVDERVVGGARFVASRASGEVQYGSIFVDETAFNELAPGTELFLYAERQTDVETAADPGDHNRTVITSGFLGAGMAVGGFNPVGVSGVAQMADPYAAGKVKDSPHWRFELTVEDAATLPFQQLCRLGEIIGKAGGEITDPHQQKDDEEMTTMLVRGPGVAPPHELFQWCAHNDVTCAVRADA